MTPRRLHRIIGVVLILPMIGWAVTGLIFFVKPGYGGAYELLNVKTYPLERGEPVTPRPGWIEFRLFRTILGEHLLILTFEGWRQLDAQTLQPMPAPSDDDVKRLVNDAFTANPVRYGRIISVAENVITTDTGVEVTLDWNRVTLQQHGHDTDRIDRLYKVHYLQWTGVKSIDRVLGFIGLSLVLALTLFGVRLAFGRRG